MPVTAQGVFEAQLSSPAAAPKATRSLQLHTAGRLGAQLCSLQAPQMTQHRRMNRAQGAAVRFLPEGQFACAPAICQAYKALQCHL